MQNGIIFAVEMDVKKAVAEIEATTDMLERALKLSGLSTMARPEARAALRALMEVHRG